MPPLVVVVHVIDWPTVAEAGHVADVVSDRAAMAMVADLVEV